MLSPGVEVSPPQPYLLEMAFAARLRSVPTSTAIDMVYKATRHTGAIREDCTAVYVGVMAAAIGEGAWPAVLSMRTLMTESNARLNKEARSYLVIASAMLGNWLNAIVNSALFDSVMHKYPPWQSGADIVVFNPTGPI